MKQNEEQKQQQAGKPQELSKEEAERVLKSLSEQEKEELKDQMKVQGETQGMSKDW